MLSNKIKSKSKLRIKTIISKKSSTKSIKRMSNINSTLFKSNKHKFSTSATITTSITTNTQSTTSTSLSSNEILSSSNPIQSTPITITSMISTPPKPILDLSNQPITIQLPSIQFKPQSNEIPNLFTTTSNLTTQVNQLKHKREQLQQIQHDLLSTIKQTTLIPTEQTLLVSNHSFEAMSNIITQIEKSINHINQHRCRRNTTSIREENQSLVLTYGNHDDIGYSQVPYTINFKHFRSIEGDSHNQSVQDLLAAVLPDEGFTKVEIENMSHLMNEDTGESIDKWTNTWDIFGDVTISWKNTMSFNVSKNVPHLKDYFTKEIDLVQPIYNMLCDIDELSEQQLIIYNSNVYHIIYEDEGDEGCDKLDIFKGNANEIFADYFRYATDNNYYNKSTKKDPLASIQLEWKLKESLSQQQKELITTLSPILSQNYKSHKTKYISGLNIEIENVETTYHIDHDVDVTKSLSDLTKHLPQSTKQSLLLHQYNTIHISSPSILNGQWIEIQGDNTILNDVAFRKIGSFITNNNETIKLKWSNSKYNNIQQEFIQRLSTSLLHNYQQYQLPYGRKCYTFNNLITNQTNEYYLTEVNSLAYLIQEHKNNVFISSPSVLNGEWIQVQGDGSVVGHPNHPQFDRFLRGQNIEPLPIDSNDDSQGVKYMCGTIKINNNPSDVPLEPQQDSTITSP